MESPVPPPPDPGPEDRAPTAPPRRSLRKWVKTSADPEEDDTLASAIIYLTKLYSKAGRGDENSPVAGFEAVPERPQSVLQAKRLSRSGGTAEAGPGDAGSRSEAATGGAALGVMKPRAARVSRRRSWGSVAGRAGAVCLALAGLGALFFWWQTHPHTGGETGNLRRPGAGPSNSPKAAAVSREALAIADQALDAMEKKDFVRASELFADVQSRQLLLPGARYQAALVEFRLGNFLRTKLALEASIDANEAVPECQYLRAVMAAAAGDYRQAAERMAEAVQAAPFSPRYYFFWGECLRRQGKPSEAATRLEQALRCRPSSTDMDLIGFKYNLAKLEAGDDPEFQTSLASQLAQKPLPDRFLLLAAANEINHSAYGAAVPFLQQAARVLSPATLQLRLQDYLFRLPAHEKDLAATWAALTPTAPTGDPAAAREQPPLVDPATRSLAEADPAIW